MCIPYDPIALLLGRYPTNVYIQTSTKRHVQQDLQPLPGNYPMLVNNYDTFTQWHISNDKEQNTFM